MEYKLISNYKDISHISWIDLIKESQFGSVFQSPDMYEFWKKQNGCTPFVYGIKTFDNKLLALCLVVIQHNGSGLKKYFSRRAIMYGGPIICDSCSRSEVLDTLLNGINNKLKSKCIYGEFRNSFSYNEFSNVFIQNNYEYLPYQNFKISLIDEDAIFADLTSEKRRQIRRSFKEGVEVSYDNNDFNVHGVYNIIKNIYLEKVKKPLPKLEFFSDLANQKLGNVVALLYQGKVIGGGFLVYDHNCVYDWYRGGLDREFKHQYPSTVAAWAVIKFGLDKKLKGFDFMGAGLKGEDYGVRKFKAQFGGDLVEHGRYIKVYKKSLYKIGKAGLQFINKVSK